MRTGIGAVATKLVALGVSAARWETRSLLAKGECLVGMGNNNGSLVRSDGVELDGEGEWEQ